MVRIIMDIFNIPETNQGTLIASSNSVNISIACFLLIFALCFSIALLNQKSR